MAGVETVSKGIFYNLHPGGPETLLIQHYKGWTSQCQVQIQVLAGEQINRCSSKHWLTERKDLVLQKSVTECTHLFFLATSILICIVLIILQSQFALSWIMYALSINQGAQDELYKEISSKTQSGCSLSNSAINDMSYLKAVVKETMR